VGGFVDVELVEDDLGECVFDVVVAVLVHRVAYVDDPSSDALLVVALPT